MMERSDPVAEFLARGGQITQCAEGERALDEREIYARAQGRDDLAAQYTDQRMRDAENCGILDLHNPTGY